MISGFVLLVKQKKTFFVKKLDIWKAPKIVVFHLKRFIYLNSTITDKITTYVNFPFNLQLADYVLSTERRDCLDYKLYAVCNHLGNVSGSGHYTTYFYHQTESKWYIANDGIVDEMSSENIITNDAYLLFYNRQESTSASSSSPDSQDKYLQNSSPTSDPEQTPVVDVESESASTSILMRSRANQVNSLTTPTQHQWQHYNFPLTWEQKQCINTGTAPLPIVEDNKEFNTNKINGLCENEDCKKKVEKWWSGLAAPHLMSFNEFKSAVRVCEKCVPARGKNCVRVLQSMSQFHAFSGLDSQRRHVKLYLIMPKNPRKTFVVFWLDFQ